MPCETCVGGIFYYGHFQTETLPTLLLHPLLFRIRVIIQNAASGGGGLCSRSLLWSVNTEQAGVWWLPSWRGERDGSSSTSNSPARSRSSLGCTKRQWRGIRKSATR